MIKNISTADSSPVIHVHNLSVSVDGKSVLNGIELQIGAGSCPYGS